VGFLDYLRKVPYVIAGVAVAFKGFPYEVKGSGDEDSKEEEND